LVDQYENYGDEIKEESILNATTGDQPTLDDSLGFSPYVEAIKQFLINPSTKPPLTLSIEGPWGSGKSSFMLQLK
jgi:predicted KAP-like P-loop ATPase